MLLSRKANPSLSANSIITALVTPGKMPLTSGGVQRTPFCTQNKLLLAPSTIALSVFNNNASCAPSASAAARANICGSLLQLLKEARGSLAGSRNGEVTNFHSGGPFPSITGAGCSEMTTVGSFAPAGE